MTSTLRLIALYENKIAQTEATFAQTRNSLFQIAPINALPDELLGHIFQLALMPHCGFRDIIDPLDPIELPTHAKSLSQVCFRWRHVAMDSPNLWTHIDLPLFHPFRGELVTRGAISASRAKDMTLDVHIFEQLGHPKNPDSEYVDGRSSQLCNIIAAQAKSLKVRPTVLVIDHRPILRVLGNFLTRCSPDSLTRLVLRADDTAGIDAPDVDQSEFTRAIITFADTDRPVVGDEFNPAWRLDVAEMEIMDLLCSIKALDSHCVCFHWGSYIYHGLVDLRLTCTCDQDNQTKILHHQLMGILGSSPELQDFHLGLEVIGPKSPNTRPIRLNNLKTLHLLNHPFHSQEMVFELITPGVDPLHMVIYRGNGDMPLKLEDHTEFVNFFKRANVSQLYLVGWEDIRAILIPPARLVPNLEILILEYSSLIGRLDHDLQDPSLEVRSGELYLRSCSISLAGFRQAARRFQNITVVCDCRIDDRGMYRELCKYMCKLIEIFPDVVFVPDQDDALEAWDHDYYD